jgi:hypothetical protein
MAKKEKIKKQRPADLRFDFFLSEIGFQLSSYENGKEINYSCRDFGGNPDLRNVKSLIRQEMIILFEKLHKF